ncbi:MAG TPA: hypothetical protein VGB63_11930 [Pedobacter sp.]|jgi:hypothetical protein
MKKATLILGFLVASFAAVAQVKDDVKQSDLKGPEYKNYQHWRHKTVPTVIYSATNIKSLQGPEFKNNQRGRNISKEDLGVVKIVGDERQNLKGPEYKNYNPFRRKLR